MEKHPRPTRACLFSNNYSYFREEDPDGSRIITRHHIIAKRKWMPEFIAWSTVLVLMTFICTLLLPIPTVAEGSSLIGTVLLCVLSAAVIHGNGIEEETVVVMPTLGVQLETCYKSGKVSGRFVPIGDILAAVINEAVTPFTCYSYLALVLRDERKLALVFQGLRPPLDMLVPTWKSLCSAVSGKMLQ